MTTVEENQAEVLASFMIWASVVTSGPVLPSGVTIPPRFKGKGREAPPLEGEGKSCQEEERAGGICCCSHMLGSFRETEPAGDYAFTRTHMHTHIHIHVHACV